MGLPDSKDLVGLTYRDAWQMAGGARWEKTPNGLESVLRNLGFSERDVIETPADARDVLALAGAYEPNSVHVQELNDPLGRGSFLFPILAYQEERKKPGLWARLRDAHPWVYKGLVFAATVGTMGLAALGGFGPAKPAEAYHEPQHDYDRLADSVLALQDHINQSAVDGAVSQSEMNVLGNDVFNLRPSLQAAIAARSEDTWEISDRTLRGIYENMSKLETPQGGVPVAIEESPERVQALQNLRSLFANWNYSLYDIGMIASGQGIDSWPAFAIASNQTKVGLDFNKLGWWAYSMYQKYKEVLAGKTFTQGVSHTIFFTDASYYVDGGGYEQDWYPVFTGCSNGVVDMGELNYGLKLQSIANNGCAGLESRFKAKLEDGPIYVEAQLQSNLANPRARPILALYYDWDNQIVLERGLRLNEDFNGQAKTFELVNNSGYGYMTGADLDLANAWHTVKIRASKNHAQLGIDDSWSFNHTSPTLIPSDKPLKVKFMIFGDNQVPDQILRISYLKFSGFEKGWRQDTVSGISAIGPDPDAVALKNYLQGLLGTADFFDQWLSNQSLRASQQGKFWSETANSFRNSIGDELRDFRIAIDRRDPNIPYEEPDITPPSITAISVPSEVYQFESVRIGLLVSDGGPEDRAGVDRILLTVKGPGGLEEQILVKPGSFAFFNNTTKAGTYTIEALAFDRSNNTSQLKVASFGVLGDTIPPTFRGGITERSYEVGTKIIGVVNATDDGPAPLKGIERIEIKIERPDGLEDLIITDKNGSFEYVPEQVGRYRHKTTAFDKSGNQGPVLGDFFDTWEDKTPPEITNVTYKREVRVGEKQRISVTALDDLVGVSEVTVNITDRNGVTWYSGTSGGAEPENKTYSFDHVLETAGNYTLTVTAKDRRNNTKEQTHKFKVLPALPNDTVPPQIRILSKPEKIYANAPFRIVFEVTDDSDEFWGEIAFHDESAVRSGNIVRSPATGLTAQIYTVTGTIGEKGRLGLELRAHDANNSVTETLWYNIQDAPETKTTTAGAPSWWPLLLLAGGVGGFAAWRYFGKTPLPGWRLFRNTPPLTPEQQALLQPAFRPVAATVLPQPMQPAPQAQPVFTPPPPQPTAGIEEILYITNDGRPLNYKTAGMPKDAEIISGMFAAVASFVKDSGWEGALDEIKLGGRRIMIERGRNSFLAAYVGGQDGGAIKPILRRGVVDLESAFRVEMWDGDKNKAVAATNPYLDAILRAAPQTGQAADYAPHERVIIKPVRPKAPEVPPGKIQFTRAELLALRGAIPALVDIQKRLADLEAKLATANAQERLEIEKEIKQTRLLLGKSSEGEIGSGEL